MPVIASVERDVTGREAEDIHVRISSSIQYIQRYGTNGASVRTVSSPLGSSELMTHLQTQQDGGDVQEPTTDQLEETTHNRGEVQMQTESTTVRTVDIIEESFVVDNSENTNIENGGSALGVDGDHENVQSNETSGGENDEIISNHSSNRQLRRMGGQREQMWETTGDHALPFDINAFAEVVDMRLKAQIQTCGFILGAVIGPMAFYVETAIPNVSSDLFRRLWFRRGASLGLAMHIVLVVLCFGSLTWSLMN